MGLTKGVFKTLTTEPKIELEGWKECPRVEGKGRTSLVQRRTLGEQLERDFQVRGAPPCIHIIHFIQGCFENYL